MIHDVRSHTDPLCKQHSLPVSTDSLKKAHLECSVDEGLPALLHKSQGSDLVEDVLQVSGWS